MPAQPRSRPVKAPNKPEIHAAHEKDKLVPPKQLAAADAQAQKDKFEQSQVRFRTVFDHSPLGNKIIDSELVIRQANPAVVAMLGFTHPSELVGHKIVEFAHPDYRDDWQNLQEHLWQHKMPYFVLETCLMHQNGSSLWCQVTSVLFEDEAGELGYTSLQDITQRKVLEETNKRLYDAQETILQLVAHDLKNPIANIQLLVDLLERDAAARGTAPAADASESQRLLTLIKQACDEANTLLKDVLYLGQLEATKLEKYRLDFNAFLDAQLVLPRITAREKGIELILELPARVQYVSINPDKFSRVVANLLTNALKFTPRGGQVCVRLQVHLGGVRLSVRDTGVGIPAELQAHVFDKFSTAIRAGVYGEATTGLGLFITRQIVWLHQGNIWLASHENEGTTIFIDLI